MRFPATQGISQGGGSKRNETLGKEQNLILKDEAPGDAGFSDIKHLPGSKACI